MYIHLQVDKRAGEGRERGLIVYYRAMVLGNFKCRGVLISWLEGDKGRPTKRDGIERVRGLIGCDRARCWVSFLLIRITVWQRSTVLAVSADGVVKIFFLSLFYHFSFFSPSSTKQLDVDRILSQRAFHPKTTNRPTDQPTLT